MKTKQRLIILLIFTLLFTLPLSNRSQADVNPTTLITGKLDSANVLVNNNPLLMDTPAVLVSGKIYIPAKSIANYLAIPLTYIQKSDSIELEPNVDTTLTFNLTKKTINIMGVSTPFKDKAIVIKDKLMVSLSWFASQTGAKITYDPIAKTFSLQSIPYVYVDKMRNSPPVAKFTFGKESYKLGETIVYTDLSYDPDTDGIRSEWTGKQEVFFKPGTYPISLKIYDSKNNASAVFTKNLIIEDTFLLTEDQYPVYNQPVGTSFKTNWNWIQSYFTNIPNFEKQETIDTSRVLLVSDSPETFKETGILYQDTINGKARLYADHINGTKDKIRFNIQVRNLTDQPVTLKTTNKGEVAPSVYANLIGSAASVDFLLHNPVYSAPMVILPGQTAIYVQMPDFYPDQGVNLFYDVETDGQLQVAFVASLASADPVNPFDNFKLLPYVNHVRGTFTASDKHWDVDLTNLNEPTRLIFGDGIQDTYVTGFDVLRQESVVNSGNYGVVYTVHSDKPRKMAVLLVAKGGVFKGPFVINGQFMNAPASGVISAFQSVQVLARTTGTEASFDLEFTPPAGSAFPIDVIFYPLD